MVKIVEHNEYIAFHPGRCLKDYMDELNMNPEELANTLGIAPQSLLKIINGKKSIDVNIASKLAETTGISKLTWLNLQSKYDSQILKSRN